MTTECNESNKAVGSLDIPRLFQAEALSLLEAVERGKLLHATKNIRDSGGPLEARLRGMLADRMPECIQVRQGYLYDVDSNCTPQIDAMVLSGLDNHTMMTANDGAIYAPFTSALAILEIKSSVRTPSEQLKQTNEIAKRIQGMGEDLRQRRRHGGSILTSPLSVLFYASSRGAKLDDFKQWNAKNSHAMPTYIVFLDRACIIAKQSQASVVMDFGNTNNLGFDDHQNSAGSCLWVPESQDEYKSGRVLLWLYFALLNSVSQFVGNTRPAGDFIRDVEVRHPLVSLGELAEFSDWPLGAEL